MASTYSTSLQLQLIGNGEQSGVWGSTTNTNWNLIEQAVAGVTTITMTNSDYTLSVLNGASDEARNMVLMVGGTNSAIRKIVAPLVNKMYVVFNNTAGGYAITIGGATGSTVTIPNGVTAQVYCDGVNFYSAQTGSAGNFNVNGNFSVNGTTTLANLTATLYTGAWAYMPAGTVASFSQSAAPTGWTQVTSDAANNRMLRVVNDGTGGSNGGSSDPTLMNVVPFHTHGFTTGGMNANNPHAHSVYDPGHRHDQSNWKANDFNTGYYTTGSDDNQGGPYTGYPTGYAGTGIGIYNTDINHAHSGSTDGGSSQTNWTPRYINIILCSKN